MNNEAAKGGAESVVEVILGWDDVFGRHVQVRGGVAEARRLVEELAEIDIEARAEADGVNRLRREGCALVMLIAAVRSEFEEREVREWLLEKGYGVEPAKGLERVPCPYGERLRPLLSRGSYFEGAKAATAAELGLRAEDGAELLRMAVDPEFDCSWHADSVWGPAWAWLLIGEMKPEGAVPVLLRVLERLDTDEGDDAATEILPEVFGRIGPEVAGALTEVLRDEARKAYSRWAAADGLREIARAWPDTRAEMMAILTAQLEEQAVRDTAVNGGIVNALMDLKAVESAAVIERAFHAQRVDETITGGWEEVQVEMGLKEPPRFVPRIGLYGSEAVRREAPKVGRNDPCPCGSGKKFKKCCGG